MYVWLLQGEQWRDLMFSPKWACLALRRLAETGPGSYSSSRSGGELSFWARYYLIQARGARLSENAWELEARRCSCSPGEEPHLWVRGGLAQARRACLSENSRVLQGSLLAVSPKRGPVAWVKDLFRLSEGPWLERDWHENLLHDCSFSCFKLINCKLGLDYPI